MKAIEYTTVDKSDWEPGPWQSEPDKRQWIDEATGLPCLIKRNPRLGFWCGYVGVPRGHLYYKWHYDDVDVDVHGGLTFSDKCSKGPEATSICHLVEAGEDDDVWWLGFDCGHAFDLSPGTVKSNRLRGWEPFPEDVYRDQSYVESEVRRLAKQLATIPERRDGHA